MLFSYPRFSRHDNILYPSENKVSPADVCVNVMCYVIVVNEVASMGDAIMKKEAKYTTVRWGVITVIIITRVYFLERAVKIRTGQVRAKHTGLQGVTVKAKGSVHGRPQEENGGNDSRTRNVTITTAVPWTTETKRKYRQLDNQ